VPTRALFPWHGWCSHVGAAAPSTCSLSVESRLCVLVCCYVRSGDIGHRFILRALMDANQTALLHALHTSTLYGSYGYILGLNATSLPENWDGSESQLHSMLGHVEEWFYEGVLGLRCTAAACRVAPAPHAWVRSPGLACSPLPPLPCVFFSFGCHRSCSTSTAAHSVCVCTWVCV
jgi:hypothetical protein